LKTQVKEEDWLRIGLAALGNQERKAYLTYYAAGYVSPPIVRLLLGQIDDILDGLKAGGITGYRTAVEAGLGFDWRFQLALRLLRHFGWSGLLARSLVNRFEVLLATIAALNSELKEGLPKVTEVVGDDVGRQLKEALELRLELMNQAFDALELQYPEYSRTLQECHLQRIAIRLEESDYQSMYDQAIVSKEVLSNLETALEKRARGIESLPQLDLGLKPAQLIARVPFFEDLDSKRIAEIAKLLKPRLAVPGENIIRVGDIGDSMFFITSGAVEVELAPEPVNLGSGDFFGEIALVNDRPRVANVKAQCFCDLLVLFTRDFNTLLAAHPEIQHTIHAVAAERLKSIDQPFLEPRDAE
jgi:CPA1 family monovalent cation:H+ antiporter